MYTCLKKIEEWKPFSAVGGKFTHNSVFAQAYAFFENECECDCCMFFYSYLLCFDSLLVYDGILVVYSAYISVNSISNATLIHLLCVHSSALSMFYIIRIHSQIL